MKSFDVYVHSSGDTVAVKEGFSWPALFFGPIWAFVKGLVLLGFLLLISIIVLRILEVVADVSQSPGLTIIVPLLYIALPLVVGTYGNDWRRNKLLARGYTLKRTVEAETPAIAIAEVRKGAVLSEICERLEKKSTVELKEIYQHNRVGWSAEEFAVVHKILLERGEISAEQVKYYCGLCSKHFPFRQHAHDHVHYVHHFVGDDIGKNIIEKASD